MNWDQEKGKLNQAKGKDQQQRGKVTYDDLDVIDGNDEEFAGRIQERYGRERKRREPRRSKG